MIILFLITVFAFYPCTVQGACNCGRRECTIPIQHYKELGCDPVYSRSSPCPLYFKCPNIGNRSPDKCYYRGKVYNIDERIEEANNNGNCLGGCTCAKNDKIANIICYVYDCAPPPHDFEHQDCYVASEHKTCCQSRLICPPFDNIAKCIVNGTTYYEGQRFTSPTYEKLNCICNRGFYGRFVEPFCYPVNCGIEIYNSESIRRLCAPVFTDDSVCPINWYCNTELKENTKEDCTSEQSSHSSEISNKGNKSNMKCRHGNKKYKIGDKFTIKSNDAHYSDMKCECLVPPLLTCFQSYIGS